MSGAARTMTSPTAFDELDEALERGGARGVLDRLIDRLEAEGPPRALLDALMLRARLELGLPAIVAGSLADWPEPVQARFEERYIAALRHVGSKLLVGGEIAEAWPYFRLLGETQPVADALDAFEPGPDDERVGPLIEIAFHQGAHPRRGFELILQQYGICSAITAFEGLPADDAVRRPCAERLVRALHAQLVSGLRADITGRGQPVPPEGASIPELIAGRPWLFADDNYHTDVSHLAAVVRMSLLLTDPEPIRLALELTDYGRHLSERFQYESDPLFERLYEGHGIYLQTLLGEEVEAGLAYFRAQLPPPDHIGEASETRPAQLLICLLDHLGRLDEAIDVAAAYLCDVPDGHLICNTPAQLCRRAGRLDRLAALARQRGHLVEYAAAILHGSGGSVL